MCFQYTTKLRHNVVYVFSIFNGDVITPNLGKYRTDMTISSTALNQSKLLNYFQQIIKLVKSLRFLGHTYTLKHTKYEPVLWRISKTVAQSKIKSDLHVIDPRLHDQKHDFMRPIPKIEYCWFQTCNWTANKNSPPISSGRFPDSIACNCLDIESAELSGWF